MKFVRPLLSAVLALGAIGNANAQAQAQATLKPDGQWRATLGLGGSMSSGNSKTSNLSLAGDAVRATDRNKMSVAGTAQYARTGDQTTAQQWRLGGRYDQNLGTEMFGFGGLGFENNRFANISLRGQASGGMGWHAVKSPTTVWDLFGGLSYTREDYEAPTLIHGAIRDSYSYVGLLLGEESTHKLTETTSAKQRLSIVPNLSDAGTYRANFDAGLAVAMTKALSLNVGFSVAYNSDPGPGFKTTDTLLTTGISVKFD